MRILNSDMEFVEEIGSEYEQRDGDDIEMDVERQTPNVKSFNEAILALEVVNQFLKVRGYIQASNMVGALIDQLDGLKAVSTTSKQTTIHDFFHTE